MSTDLYKGIGRRIAAFRKLDGLTAQQLAERVPGLTANGVAKIEGGHRAVLPVELVLDIAFALRVPPASLMFPLGQRSELVTIGGEEWHMGNLYPWVVGPPTEFDEGDTWDTAAWYGAALVEAARSASEHEAELIERWGADGEHATTDDEHRKYLEARTRTYNAVQFIAFLGRDMVSPNRIGKPREAGDHGDD